MAHPLVDRLRRDAPLIAGLCLALLAAFHPAVQRAFDWVKALESHWRIAFLPALIILFAALAVHQSGRRHQVATTAAAHAAEARAMRLRTEELEHIVAFEGAVAESLDLLSLRQAIERHLPPMCGLRDTWVMLRISGRWEALVQWRASPGTLLDGPALERLAERAIGPAGPAGPFETEADGHTLFTLRVGGEHVGALGVATRDAPLSGAERRTLEAAAGLMAIGARNVELVGEIREHSLRDSLTGCFNRAHAIETLQVELRRAQRGQFPVSAIMLDLDHFKEINDVHGHLAGDAVLARTGTLLREALRASDHKNRYGGEEFLLVLPDTTAENARTVAEMLRGAIARAAVAHADRVLRVTASFGVTTAAPGEIDAEAIVARADAALYDAKHAGRDCVRAVPAPTPEAVDLSRLRLENAVRETPAA